MNTKQILLFAACIWNTNVFAQENEVIIAATTFEKSVFDIEDYVKKEKTYEKTLTIHSAIDFFLSKEISYHNNPCIQAKIANNYRKNNEPEMAEIWYRRFIENADDAIHYLRFSQVLQANNKKDEAIKWLKKYAKANPKFVSLSRNLENSEDFRPKRKNIAINNLQNLNSEGFEFSAIPYNDGIVFTTIENQPLKNNKTNYSKLFFAQKLGDNKFENPIDFASNLKVAHHIGNASFSNDGEQMFYSISLSENKWKNKKITLNIAKAVKDGMEWKEEEVKALNCKGFTSCHPSINKEGDKIYFASDRPGGFGGMDIYVSEFLNGQWQSPVNLGPQVNTTTNEIFPFVDQKGILYFSSERKESLGGLDIFRARWTDHSERDWLVENMGEPFNSDKDDFSFVILKNYREGFFSSNRSGKNKDDIYSWNTKKN